MSRDDEFSRLQQIWSEKLKTSGFTDIERADGVIKSPINFNTDTWRQSKDILSFFLRLDCLLLHYHKMPPFERKVMTMYSKGIKVKDIIKRCPRSPMHVHNCIKRYKNLVLAIEQMISHED